MLRVFFVLLFVLCIYDAKAQYGFDTLYPVELGVGQDLARLLSYQNKIYRFDNTATVNADSTGITVCFGIQIIDLEGHILQHKVHCPDSGGYYIDHFATPLIYNDSIILPLTASFWRRNADSTFSRVFKGLLIYLDAAANVLDIVDFPENIRPKDLVLSNDNRLVVVGDSVTGKEGTSTYVMAYIAQLNTDKSIAQTKVFGKLNTWDYFNCVKKTPFGYATIGRSYTYRKHSFIAGFGPANYQVTLFDEDINFLRRFEIPTGYSNNINNMYCDSSGIYLPIASSFVDYEDGGNPFRYRGFVILRKYPYFGPMEYEVFLDSLMAYNANITCPNIFKNQDNQIVMGCYENIRTNIDRRLSGGGFNTINILDTSGNILHRSYHNPLRRVNDSLNPKYYLSVDVDNSIYFYMASLIELENKDLVFTGRQTFFPDYNYSNWVKRMNKYGEPSDIFIPFNPADTGNFVNPLLSKTDGFKLFPNPNRGLLQSEAFENFEQYFIYSVEGKLLQEGTLQGQRNVPINSNIPNGLYFMHLSHPSKGNGMGKFLLER